MKGTNGYFLPALDLIALAARGESQNREASIAFSMTPGQTFAVSADSCHGLLDEGTAVVERETWSDYDGDTLYASYTASNDNPPVISDLVHYEPGLGESTDPRSNPQTRFYAHDHLGTVVGTYGSGTPSNPEHRVFTAYGEIVDAPAAPPRLGYAGARGYQGNDDLPLLHVGHRYYDPSVGRFLQRDPIGIVGGVNIYAYVHALPNALVDPLGLISAFSTPQGFIAAIEAELSLHGTTYLTFNGTTYLVTNLARTGTATCHTISIIGPRGKVIMDFTYNIGDKFAKGVEAFSTSGGFVYNSPSCGATGIEAIPFICLVLLIARRRGAD